MITKFFQKSKSKMVMVQQYFYCLPPKMIPISFLLFQRNIAVRFMHPLFKIFILEILAI